MSRPPDRLLSTFRIVRPPNGPGKALLPCPRLRERGQRTGLATHVDPGVGRKYDEQDLEEWIARSPEAIFPRQPMVVLSAEKYGRLDAKASADLLFVDRHFQFHVVETKIPSIAKKRGVSCKKLHTQMQRYANRLEKVAPGFPRSLWDHYHSFSQRFYGYRRNLTMRLAEVFGPQVPRRKRQRPPEVCQVYVAGEFDDQAIHYFERRAKESQRLRLVYYRYYPETEYIEFWEIPVR